MESEGRYSGDDTEREIILRFLESTGELRLIQERAVREERGRASAIVRLSRPEQKTLRNILIDEGTPLVEALGALDRNELPTGIWFQRQMKGDK